MVRWGSASSLEQREWDQRPKFSLCQPIASRDMARDIWPCHRDACRWCISQLGSTLSSMKLWEWLQGGWVGRGERGRGGGEKHKGDWRKKKKRRWVLDQPLRKHEPWDRERLAKDGLLPLPSWALRVYLSHWGMSIYCIYIYIYLTVMLVRSIVWRLWAAFLTRELRREANLWAKLG